MRAPCATLVQALNNNQTNSSPQTTAVDVIAASFGMAPTRRVLGASAPCYGKSLADGHEEEEFTIELHHGGFFCGVGSSRIYLDEKVDWFDHCDTDTWSSLWLDDFIEQLGYDNSERKVKVYWLLPGKTFSDGLRRINFDASTNSMVALVPRLRSSRPELPMADSSRVSKVEQSIRIQIHEPDQIIESVGSNL
ncbi:hypothetical protein OsJ_05830 [Oryza sativa Japonica Group]|uniref:PB1-like domain-containing protein n=1 Tax=Oryza sativa subsp. japonica TaxID=39947 RepID=A3A4C8_ORYSJ|nr:hypothetical protein OsJ_05830 [Oryza sativa Japonica Group]